MNPVILKQPTTFSIQVSEFGHMDDAFFGRLNHSNTPNIFVDCDHYAAIALTKILPNDLLHFFYPSTEWEMASPFVITEESDPELQNIRGAKHLSVEILARYQVNNHILNLVKKG